MTIRWGVDLGGTKIELLGLASGEEVYRKRLATPQGDYAATLQTIVNLIEEAETHLGVKGSVGVGIPGAISPHTGRIKNANSVCLIGQDLQGDLQKALARPVKMANDADCFTLSEATDGAGAGAKSVFGVIIGTGCGGGLVYQGQLISGPNAIAGEWGHKPLPWADGVEKGRACYCGKIDCIETYLSGPGWSKTYQHLASKSLSAKAIGERLAQGEAQAKAAFEIYARQLAKSLASVINLFDPEVIVLGGGMSQLAPLYERVPELWGEYVFSDAVYTRLLPPKFGDASGVRGAAWL